MPSFNENFWGEKNNGFYVLFSNFKQGQTSTKDFIDFLRESCAVEENYSKLLIKLSKAINNNTCAGTFAPFWECLRHLSEQLSTLHMKLVVTWSELIKDVARYHEEQHKKYKTMKESEAATSESVQLIQQTTASLHRSREIYHTRCLELERLKRDNASPKDVDKAEVRNKKACDEYRSYVDKYTTVRGDFESKMVSSCKNLQDTEEAHLLKMKDFVETYYRAWVNHHALIGQVYGELKHNCDELTVEMLIDKFITAKSTGQDKPRPIQFEEPDITKLSLPVAMTPTNGSEKKLDVQDSPDLGDQPGPLSRSVKLRVSRTWFLKKKKDKKAKKKDKDKDNESISTNSLDDSVGPIEGGVVVDDEGFTIRPEDTADNIDKNSWYSSSDSDSDGEDHKLKVEIRPLSANGALTSGTIEDIRASVEALRLSPTTTTNRRRTQVLNSDRMHRSQSLSDTLDSIAQPPKETAIDFVPTTPTTDYSTLPSPLAPIDIKSIETDVKGTQHASLSQMFSTNFADFDSQNDKPALPPKTNKSSRISSLSSLNTVHRTPPSNGVDSKLPPDCEMSLQTPSRSTPALIPPLKASTLSALRPHPKLSLPKDLSILDDDSLVAALDTPTEAATAPPTNPSKSQDAKNGKTTPIIKSQALSDSKQTPTNAAREQERGTPTGGVAVESSGDMKTPPLLNMSSVSSLNDTSLLSQQSLQAAMASPDSGISVHTSTPSEKGPAALPRPKPPLTQGRSWGRTSPASFLSRADSGSSSVTFSTTPAIGSSRGPSPLTLGMSDTIPIAVAFTETVNAYFRGTDASKCIVKLTGGLMMSFPAGIVHAFTDNRSPAMLSFRINHSSQLDQVTINSHLLSQDMTSSTDIDSVYTFDMTTLADHLKTQSDTNKSAQYFNIDILKYQVKTSNGIESTPLPLVCYWKCENNQTDYRLDYKFNQDSLPPATVLRNVSAAVVVDGDVTNMQSIPSGSWLSEQKRATWKLADICATSDDTTQGSIRAKFHVNNGPTVPSATAIQFTCDGCTLSGIEFELVGTGYRVSLAKKRFGTGRYLVEPDSSIHYI